MSKTPSKTKTRAANVAVPQSRDEAAGFIREIGENARKVARIEADMNDKLAKIKQAAEALAAPLSARNAELTTGLQTWCDAHRSELTDGGKRKFAEFGTGRVEWRYLPPSVSLKNVGAILARIKELGLPFLRVKEEIDKERMLADPVNARLVLGVTIGSAGEQFSVAPFEAQIEGGQS